MNSLVSLNNTLVKHLPLYEGAFNFTTSQYKRSVDTLSTAYTTSIQTVKNAKAVSNKYKTEVVWVLGQATSDFLQVIESKLQIEEISTKRTKIERIMNILKQLKIDLSQKTIKSVFKYGSNFVNKGKTLNQKYMLPIYASVKATLEISWEVLIESLAEKLGALKMTYTLSKNNITLLLNGQFEEEKILAKIKENFGNFKQLTIKIVQKGLEIKISKKDLYENYVLVLEKISFAVNDVQKKGKEEWIETKSKTLNLYKTILNRIKEKQIQIITEYTKKEEKTVQITKKPIENSPSS